MASEEFTISASYNGRLHDLRVIPHSDVDQTIYEIWEDDTLLFAMGIVDNGTWEPDREVPDEAVNAIGRAIEAFESKQGINAGL